MVTVSLEEVIKKTIDELRNGKVNERVKVFTNYDSKFAVLKPEVKVEISLSEGVVATIDVSDFFKEELK